MNKSRKDILSIKKAAAQCGVRLGDLSVAILLTSLECGGSVISGILGNSLRIGRVANQPSELRSVWDYLKEIRHYREHNIYITTDRLKKKGLLDPKTHSLTKRGKKLSDFLRNVLQKQADEQRRWDGKIRLIAFNIPEVMKKNRVWFCQKLEIYGFVRFQKSVFIGKFPISEEVYRALVRKGLGSYIRLLTIGDIDDNEILEQLA